MVKTEKYDIEKLLDRVDSIFLGKEKLNQEFISYNIYQMLDIVNKLDKDSQSRFILYLEEAYGFYI